MKKKDHKQAAAKKVPRQTKDFIPAPMLKNLHSMEHIAFQSNSDQFDDYTEVFTPSHILPEWTYQSAEEVNAEIYQEETQELFEDPEHDELTNNLPLYFARYIENEIKWDRPTTYVINYYLDKEIQLAFPKKNYTSRREDIMTCYSNRVVEDEEDEEDEEEEDILNVDSEATKQKMYKDLYKYIEKPYEYKVVNCESRIETDEEYLQRKQDEEKFNQKKQGKKVAKAKKPITKADETDKMQVYTPLPSSLTLINFKPGHLMYDHFHAWLASIFQMILDQKINDAQTRQSIISNIYPQTNGAPIYNPKGKYIIKMYCMGKPRKVLIDDRIPCNKDHEFILPHCTYLEELWPALFTKALLKVLMYKVRHPTYYLDEEYMDPFVIYALTGLHGKILNINDNKTIMSLFANHFRYEPHEEDENNLFFALFKYHKYHSFNDKKSYENYLTNQSNVRKQKKLQKAILNFDIFESNPATQKQKSRFDMNRNPNNNLNIPVARSRKMSGRNSGQLQQFPDKLAFEPNIMKFERNSKRTSTLVQSKTSSSSNTGVPKKLINDNNIITNFLYSVIDYFNNETFNMKRLRYLDFSDLHKQLNSKKVLFKQLPLTEKKAYLLSARDLKKKQLDEKNKRINQLKEIGDPYRLLKIINQALYLPEYNGFSEYVESEIIYAKKCLVNKWEFPPVSYFSSYFNAIKKEAALINEIEVTVQKELESPSYSPDNENKKAHKSTMSFVWTEEAYIQLIGGNLEIYETCKEPRTTRIPGQWLSFQDLSTTFDKILIIYNQDKLYQSKVFSDNSWEYYKTDVFEPLEEYNAFILNNEPITNKECKYSMIVIFEPYSEVINKEKTNYIFPYITFDLVHLQTQEVIQGNIILNKFYSIWNYDELEGENNYGLIIKGGLFPTGYILQVMSQGHQITNMSMNDYLKQTNNYQSITIKAEHSNIDPNTYWLISRIMISFETESEEEEQQHQQQEQQLNECKLKVSLKYPVKYIKQEIMIYLHTSQSQEKREVTLDQFLFLTEKELEDNCYIIFSIKSEHKIKENQFDIDILYDNPTIKFEQVEHIEPYMIFDKYLPNKNRVLFSEYIYPSDKVCCSLEIKLKHLNIEDESKKVTDKKKPPAKTGGNDQSSLMTFSEGKDIEQKTRLKLELYHLSREPSIEFQYDSLRYSYSNQGELIQTWDFYNELTISQMTLEGDFIQSILDQNSKKKTTTTKKDPKEKQIDGQAIQPFPYLLICYFDHNEVSEEIIQNTSDDIGWCIKVFSSDCIGFIKDTSKLDHENKLKDGWESNENGRSLKASKSRKKFLCLEKQKKGIEINKEEEELILEERDRRRRSSVNEDSIKNPGLKKGKTPAVANAKKPTGGRKGEKMPSEKKLPSDVADLQKGFSMQSIFDQPLPRTFTSKANYVTTYLDYAYKERTFINKSQLQVSIRNHDVRDKIKMAILQQYEDNEKSYKDNSIMMFMKTRDELSNSLRSLNKSNSTARLTKKGQNDLIYSDRTNLQQSYQRKYEMEQTIKDVLKEGIQKNFDINYVVSVYKEGVDILGIGNQVTKQLFNFISQRKEENLRNELKKLTAKDQAVVIKMIEDIEYNKWDVSDETISKLKGLLK